MKNYQIQIIEGANLNFQAPLGYNRLQIGLVFAEYYRFKTSNLLPNIKYTSLSIILTVSYQFLETGTSDRNLTYLDQLLKCSGFSLYSLSIFLHQLSFSLFN